MVRLGPPKIVTAHFYSIDPDCLDKDISVPPISALSPEIVLSKADLYFRFSFNRACSYEDHLPTNTADPGHATAFGFIAMRRFRRP